MKDTFPGPYRIIGMLLLKLIYGPGYQRHWWSDPYSHVRGTETALTLLTVLWAAVLVVLLTDTVPLHAVIYLLAYPAALLLWTIIVRTRK